MSAIHASVSCGLSQVSVTARMSIVLEIIRSVREAVFSRIERMLVVARRMLCLTTGPGLRLTSPASSKIKANLNVGGDTFHPGECHVGSAPGHRPMTSSFPFVH